MYKLHTLGALPALFSVTESGKAAACKMLPNDCFVSQSHAFVTTQKEAASYKNPTTCTINQEHTVFV